MLSLADIQQRFKEATVGESPADTALLGLQSSGTPSDEGFDVYYRGYTMRIAECLADLFPSLFKWLERDSFDDLVRAYLHEYPSRYKSVVETGRHFGDFLDSVLGPGDPAFLPDLVRFEWARVCARYTDQELPEDAQPLTEFQGQASARLLLTPSLTLFPCAWPVDQLARCHVPPVAFRETVRLAIYRSPTGVRVDRLWPRQWDLLGLLATGIDFGALEKWVANEKITPAQIQRWFTAWAAKGLIYGFRLQK